MNKALLVSRRGSDEVGDCPKNDMNVTTKRDVPSVLGVPSSLHCVGHSVVPFDLGETRQAGSMTESSATSTQLNEFSLRGDWRTRPHETHVTAHDVEQLGQLIDACTPNEPSNPGDDQLSGLSGLDTRTVDGHAPEFEEREFSAILADANLSKEGRATVVHANSHCRENENRQK
jgi:hypothetical protein